MRLWKVIALVIMTMKSVVGLSVTKVAVIGASGRLGRRAVDQLVARQIPCKCLIRGETLPNFLKEHQKANLVEVVKNGDVTDSESIKTLLQGCSHCLALHGATAKSSWREVLTAAESQEDTDPTHSKQINYKSIRTIVKIAEEVGCDHVVRITGNNEKPWSFFSILINGLGRMAKGWNYEGEQVLRMQSKVDYTIIRPGIMKDDYDPVEAGVHLEVKDNGGYLKISPVSYSQIAELCIESLLQSQARRSTLTAMNVENNANGGSLTVGESLKLVKSDSRLFPETLIAEHKRAVTTVFRSLALVAIAVFVKIVKGIL